MSKVILGTVMSVSYFSLYLIKLKEVMQTFDFF